MSIWDELDELAGPTIFSYKPRKRVLKHRLRADGTPEQQCWICKEWKTHEHFHVRRETSMGRGGGGQIKKGLQGHCKLCGNKTLAKKYRRRA